MRRSLGVAVVAALTIVAIYGLAVANPWGQLIDTALMTATARVLDEPDWAHTVLDLISPFTVLAGATLVAVLGLVRGRPSDAARAFGVATATPVVSALLKRWLDRPSVGVDELLNSLPSGHVAAVAGLVAAGWFVAARSWRGLWVLAGAGAVAATGVATLALQWHRPSDVAAAVALAVVVGAIAGALGAPTPRRTTEPRVTVGRATQQRTAVG